MTTLNENIRMRLRQDTTADWVSRNPVLAKGEEGLDTTLNQRKVGDGVTSWTGLPYVANVSTTMGLPLKITVGTAAPTSPNVNDIWIDTT